jgi:hypothetical protein
MNYDFSNLIIKRHFGPYILRHKCPTTILESLNQYTDSIVENESFSKIYSSKHSSVPNLLKRDFEVIYLDYEFCENIGFCDYVSELSKQYINHIVTNSYDDYGNEESSFYFRNVEPTLSKIYQDSAFKYSDKIEIADAWINRYFSGDFTPMHIHGSDLSGIIFMNISDDLIEERIDYDHSDKDSNEKQYLIENNIQHYKPNGGLHFYYKSNGDIMDNESYVPEQKTGNVILFPSFLSHLVYPQKNNVERRTLSFNIIFNE